MDSPLAEMHAYQHMRFGRSQPWSSHTHTHTHTHSRVHAIEILNVHDAVWCRFGVCMLKTEASDSAQD